LNDIYDLVEVMKRLRGKNGCPWDKKQTHESLKPCLLEEAYEVLDAIDRRNDEDLKEELGDLLLQVIFHSEIAMEEGRFSIDDVAHGIVQKIIRRHPHVFSDVNVKDSDDVLKNWEKIKKGEGKKSVLEGVPNQLPALLKAKMVQEKSKRVGFDWKNIDGAIGKLYEEVEELKKVIITGEKDGVEDEFGDLLFSLVNVSRFLNIDAEESLRKTINKFMKRFKYIEEKVEKRKDKELKDYTLDELDVLWEEAKNVQ